MDALRFGSRAGMTGSSFRAAPSSPQLVVSKTPDYRDMLTISVADGANFAGGEMAIMVGYDSLAFGDAVPSTGGRDGVLPRQLKL